MRLLESILTYPPEITVLHGLEVFVGGTLKNQDS